MKQGGSTNRLPSLDEMIKHSNIHNNLTSISSTLQNQTDMFLVSGHGSMTNEVFIIPDNTWVIFLGPATLEQKIKENNELIEFTYLEENQSEEDWFKNIETKLNKGELLKNIMFSNPYDKTKTGVYEPGDIVQDLNITLMNNPYPLYFITGIWKLPQPVNVKKIADKLHNEFSKDYVTEYTTTHKDELKKLLHIPQEDNLMYEKLMRVLHKSAPIIKETITKHIATRNEANNTTKMVNDTIAQIPNNYASKVSDYKLSNRITLSSVLSDVKSTKSSRIFIIYACRSYDETKPEYTQKVTLSRSLSLSSRSSDETSLSSSEDICIIPRSLLNIYRVPKEVIDFLKDRYRPDYAYLQQLFFNPNNPKNTIPLENFINQLDKLKDNSNLDYKSGNTGGRRNKSYRKKKLRRQTRRKL